jgi:WD40 repeat protein
LWDATTGTRLAQLSQGFVEFTDPHGLAFSPDGSLLASYDCSDMTCGARHITLWDVASRLPVKQLRVNDNENPVVLAFSPDGKYLAINICVDSFCDSNQFILWNLAAGKVSFSFTSVITSFAFSANGKTLAIGGCANIVHCAPGRALLVDLISGKLIGDPFLESTGAIGQLALSPDGQTLVTNAGEHTLRIWNVTSRTSSELFGHTDGIQDLAFSADGKYFASGGIDNKVLLWRATPFTPLSHLVSTEYDGSSVAVFSPDGKTIATGNCQTQITLWDTATGAPTMTLGAGSAGNSVLGCVQYLAFSPDGKRLAAATVGGLFIVDLTTHQLLVFTNSGSPLIVVHGVMTFSPDGHFLVTSDVAGNLTVWDTMTGTPVRAFPAASARFSSGATFSPGGSLLAMGEQGNDVTLVDGHDFSTVVTLHGPTASTAIVVQVAFSPDGKMLAALNSTGTITLWQLQARTLASSFQALTTTNVSAQAYASLAFSPDGQVLAANLGQAFGLWYVATREPIIAPQRADKDVNNLVFSPDGHLLMEAEVDGTLFVRYAPSLWQAQACAIANRNFTHAEWQQIFATDPYQQIC